MTEGNQIYLRPGQRELHRFKKKKSYWIICRNSGLNSFTSKDLPLLDLLLLLQLIIIIVVFVATVNYWAKIDYFSDYYLYQNGLRQVKYEIYLHEKYF